MYHVETPCDISGLRLNLVCIVSWRAALRPTLHIPYASLLVFLQLLIRLNTLHTGSELQFMNLI